MKMNLRAARDYLTLADYRPIRFGELGDALLAFPYRWMVPIGAAGGALGISRYIYEGNEQFLKAGLGCFALAAGIYLMERGFDRVVRRKPTIEGEP